MSTRVASVQKSTAQLVATRTPLPQPLPRRGARLARTATTPHPLYAGQSLFSIYVHPSPGYPLYGEHSLFRGREIEPRLQGARWSHSLVLIFLHLLEAALYDDAVANSHFVLVSESDVPLYHGSVLYSQLLAERRSRAGSGGSYLDLIRGDQVCLPFMGV